MKRLNLVLFRMKHNMKQREMAERLGLSKGHYSNIELGFYDPSYKVMQKFRKEFANEKIDVWDVFAKEEDTKGGATVE